MLMDPLGEYQTQAYNERNPMKSEVTPMKMPSFKASSVKNALLKTLLVICFSVFSIILCGVVFANDTYNMTPVFLLIIMAASLGAIYCIYRLVEMFITTIEKHYYLILALSLLLLLAINIVTGFALRFEPVYDLGAIFTGASEWSFQGNFMDHMNPTCDPNYFYYFPNNLGGMTLLYFAFEIASLFGGSDYYAIAMITNAVLIALTVLLTALVTKRMLGIKQSLIVLVFFLIMPPFYFMAATFYTDALSIVFPILIIYLYLLQKDASSKYKKLVYAILIGLACAVGMLVKMTVLIALIAIIIYDLLARSIKSTAFLTSVSAVVIACVMLVFNSYFYANHLDKDTAEKLNTPYSHWIMMSITGEGRYNHNDYVFTRSFDDPKERNEAINDKILERINEQGAIGMLDLFYNKSIIAFGDGTFAQSDFLDDAPKHDTFLHSFLLYNSSDYGVYRYICSGIFFSLMLLMVISTFKCLRAKNTLIAIPAIATVGIMLFLMIWEVSGRYMTNFIPLILVCAANGIDCVSKKPHSIK